jgi:hypothetical protein
MWLYSLKSCTSFKFHLHSSKVSVDKLNTNLEQEKHLTATFVPVWLPVLKHVVEARAVHAAADESLQRRMQGRMSPSFVFSRN